MKCRLYIDEVGNHDLASADNDNERFLSLTGVLISLDHVKDIIHPEIEQLKTKYFSRHHPDTPLFLHRKELINAKYPFDELKDPEKKTAFDADLLSHLSNWRYRVFTVCIDKRTHRDGYTWPVPPYQYCFNVLLEKACLYLSKKGLRADVMVEAREKKSDRPLKESFQNLFQNGTDYCHRDKYCDSLTSRELKLKPKTMNIAGLQLVDLIAHTSRNEILRDNGFGIKIAPFGEQAIQILASKYDRYLGTIYGKKFIQK